MSLDTSSDVSARDRSVHAGGLRWNVRTQGRGPDLVLLHGTGGTARTWDAIAPWLAREFRLIALDLPGHGGSAYPGFEHISCTMMARRVTELLTALDVAPVGVVGHSAGAAIMLQVAAEGSLPARARLIGINPALQPPGDVAQRMLRGPVGDLFRSRAARAVVREAARVAPVIELLLASTGSRLQAAQEREYVQAFTSPAHAEAAYAMMANWDLAPVYRALPSIRQDTLFIVGANDRWVPASVAARAAARMPRARVASLPRAGHLVHEERPTDVAALIVPVLHA